VVVSLAGYGGKTGARQFATLVMSLMLKSFERERRRKRSLSFGLGVLTSLVNPRGWRVTLSLLMK
jgi:hypothetical protein